MVLKIGQDLQGNDLSDTTLISAIESVNVGIELHEFTFWVKPPTIQELICSGGIHTGLLLGNCNIDPKLLSFEKETFNVLKNDKLVTSAKAKEIMGGPLHSLRWLVNCLTKENKILPKGSLVIPGSPTELVVIDKDVKLTVAIEHVGEISVQFCS